MKRQNPIPTLVLAALALTACTEQASAIKLANADRDVLQSKATSACECALKSTGGDCWLEYKAATKPFRSKGAEGIGGTATACAPVSTELDCLKDADGEFCIVTGYYVNGFDLPNPQLCRKAEAEAIDRGWNEGSNKPNGSQVDAENAARKALAAVRNGTSRPAMASEGGCI